MLAKDDGKIIGYPVFTVQGSENPKTSFMNVDCAGVGVSACLEVTSD